jgi:hypothetical protein
MEFELGLNSAAVFFRFWWLGDLSRNRRRGRRSNWKTRTHPSLAIRTGEQVTPGFFSSAGLSVCGWNTEDTGSNKSNLRRVQHCELQTVISCIASPLPPGPVTRLREGKGVNEGTGRGGGEQLGQRCSVLRYMRLRAVHVRGNAFNVGATVSRREVSICSEGSHQQIRNARGDSEGGGVFVFF